MAHLGEAAIKYVGEDVIIHNSWRGYMLLILLFIGFTIALYINYKKNKHK